MLRISLLKSRACRALRPRAAYLRTLRRAAEITGLAAGDGTLEVVLLDARRMAALNGLHLRHRGATDVITYDFRDGDPLAGAPEAETEAGAGAERVLASIYVCPEMAAARRPGRTFSREMVLYAVHGMLHLAGEDDLAPRARAAMRRAERRVLGRLAREFDLEQFHQ